MSLVIDKTDLNLDDQICHLCAPSRRKAGLAPRPLILLGLTKKRKLEVLICPNCDTVNNDG